MNPVFLFENLKKRVEKSKARMLKQINQKNFPETLL